MSTIAWILIFVGLLITHGSSRGRGLSATFGDLGDAFMAALDGDGDALKEALSRSTTVDDDAQASTNDVSHAGSGGKSQTQIIALGHELKARGFIVGEGPPPFGPIGKHSAAGYHYKRGETGVVGMALDVNWSPASEEPRKMDELALQLRSAGWAVKWRMGGHYDHLHVDAGPQMNRDRTGTLA